MPDLGVELHDGGSEGIFGGDLNVNDEFASLVRRTRWTGNAGLEMCQVGVDIGRLGGDVRNGGISLNIGQLLSHTTKSVTSHVFLIDDVESYGMVYLFKK